MIHWELVCSVISRMQGTMLQCLKSCVEQDWIDDDGRDIVVTVKVVECVMTEGGKWFDLALVPTYSHLESLIVEFLFGIATCSIW